VATNSKRNAPFGGMGVVGCWELSMECRYVGFATMTTQIIFDNNLCATLLTLAIQQVRVSYEVAL
jgi:hypothetical protein